MEPLASVIRHLRLTIARSNKTHLVAALKSTRPGSSLVAGTLSTTATWVRSGIHPQAFVIGLTMYAVAAFGFVINDIFDYHKDAEAGVQRPIATGTLPKSNALVFALGLLSAVFLLSLAAGAGGKMLAGTVLALTLYTPAAQTFPVLKGIYVAGLCLVPLSYAAVVSHTSYSWFTYGALAVFIIGRETLMDANEVWGDKQAGMVTVAVVLGQTCSRWLGISSMILALICLTATTKGWIGMTTAALSLVSLFCVLAWPRLQESRRIELSRLPMLAAAVAIALS